MRSGNTVSRWLCTVIFGRQRLMLALLYVIIAVVFSTPLLASVNSGEIIANSVSATVSSTFDPINGFSVTFQWTTVSPSNSIVVAAAGIILSRSSMGSTSGV